MENHMKITPNSKGGACRQGCLVGITVKEINEILGFKPNIEDDPDKVENSWGFEIAGKLFGIWDYKGSHHFGEFSTYGDAVTLRKLFGERYGAN
jgi:hypothetical protein